MNTSEEGMSGIGDKTYEYRFEVYAAIILFFRISIDPHKSTRVLYRIRSALQTLSTLTVLTFHFYTIVVDHRATDRKQDRIFDVRGRRRH